MNKNLWLGVATVLVGCVAGYCFHMMTDVTVQRLGQTPNKAAASKPAGGEESSDAIEPLVVEGVDVLPLCRMPVGDTLPMPRVVMTTSMRQPPRPDAESGVLRMPYADETDGWLGLTLDRVLRILEPDLPRLNVFDPAEESENRDETPEPMVLPTPDYHHQHCPFHGPYRR